MIMNSYEIHIENGNCILVVAQWMELQNGFFVFYVNDEAIRYQASGCVVGVTKQAKDGE